MKKQLVKNLSVNTLQLIINQVFGLVIFYVLSTGLSKDSFGQVNLALAILLAVFNVLSFGIDQLSIRRVAAGDSPATTLALYLFHVLITGVLFYTLLFFGKPFFSPFISNYEVLLLIGVGKLMIFFSTPFKQVASGMERFDLLAYMAVASNIVRGISLLIMALLHSVTLTGVAILFIAGDAVELFCSVLFFTRSTRVSVQWQWHKKDYLSLLREAFPQIGVVVITSALARFDWILIGMVLSAARLAEYSFAYKVFELSTLPLTALAPLLIPKFTRLFKDNSFRIDELKLLVRAEMAVAALVALMINIAWTPLVDWMTAGKYGAVNASTILLLTAGMPLLYLNNFLWTKYFAQGRLKMILTAFVITLAVNIVGNIVLVPAYHNEGAAAAFLLASLTQTLFFISQNELADLKVAFYSPLICTACALLSGLLAVKLLPGPWYAVFIAPFIYVILLLVTRQIRKTDKVLLAALIR